MPYSVSCSPAPLTFTIRPKFGWQFALGVIWVGFITYQVTLDDYRRSRSPDVLDMLLLGAISFGILLSFIRRERIEIYPDQIVWRKTYFGFTLSNTAPVDEVLGVEWNEGEQQGKSKGPDYVEFYLSDGSVKACYGFTFDEFDHMRDDIRSMYPDLIKRWSQAGVRSKTLTLLNLT